MASRISGDDADPAAELLGRWQAHHAGTPEASDDPTETEQPAQAGESAAPRSQAGSPGTPSSPGAPGSPGQPEPSAPKHAAPRPEAARRPQSARGFDQTAAGREVIEALGITPARAPESAPEPDAVDETSETPESAERSTHEAPPPAGASTDVAFPPRVGVRRLFGLLMLALVPVTAGACYLAYDDPKTLTVGVAGTLVLLLLLLYGVRAATPPTQLAIRRGQLEVMRGNQREVFDLTSRFTRMEIIGKPGRRGWKVLMGRFGRDPLVIDSSMVDPAAFTAAIERHRPTR